MILPMLVGADINDDRYWDTPGGSVTTYYGKTKAGETVTPQTAYGLAVYFACIRVISEDIGKLSLSTIRKLDRGREVLHGHPAGGLLAIEASPRMSGPTFRETLTGHALGWGAGFAEIERSREGTPLALHLIHPSRVQIQNADDGTLVYVVQNNDGSYVEIPDRNMFKINGFGDSGVVGLSAAAQGKDMIGIGMAEQSFAGSFFGNGTYPSGVLQTAGNMDETALQSTREQWGKVHGGAGNTAKVAILHGGMTYSPLTLPLKDVQFVESRHFTIEEVCRWFRVAPHKVQHLLQSTFNNIEHQGIEHVTDTLMPWCVRWEVETNFRHLKQTLGMDILHTKTVDGIHKELAMFAIAYNLVRLVMIESAKRQGVAPERISFCGTLRWLRAAGQGGALDRIKVNPGRAGSIEPRVRKRRPKNFPLMNRPRSELKQIIASKGLTP